MASLLWHAPYLVAEGHVAVTGLQSFIDTDAHGIPSKLEDYKRSTEDIADRVFVTPSKTPPDTVPSPSRESFPIYEIADAVEMVTRTIYDPTASIHTDLQFLEIAPGIRCYTEGLELVITDSASETVTQWYDFRVGSRIRAVSPIGAESDHEITAIDSTGKRAQITDMGRLHAGTLGAPVIVIGIHVLNPAHVSSVHRFNEWRAFMYILDTAPQVTSGTFNHELYRLLYATTDRALVSMPPDQLFNHYKAYPGRIGSVADLIAEPDINNIRVVSGGGIIFDDVTIRGILFSTKPNFDLLVRSDQILTTSASVSLMIDKSIKEFSDNMLDRENEGLDTLTIKDALSYETGADFISMIKRLNIHSNLWVEKTVEGHCLYARDAVEAAREVFAPLIRADVIQVGPNIVIDSRADSVVNIRGTWRAEQIHSDAVHAETVHAKSVLADELDAVTATVDKLRVREGLVADALSVSEATTGTLTVKDDLTAPGVHANRLTADSVTTDKADMTHLSAQHVVTQTLKADETRARALWCEDANIGTLVIEKVFRAEAIETRSIVGDTATINNLTASHLSTTENLDVGNDLHAVGAVTGKHGVFDRVSAGVAHIDKLVVTSVSCPNDIDAGRVYGALVEADLADIDTLVVERLSVRQLTDFPKNLDLVGKLTARNASLSDIDATVVTAVDANVTRVFATESVQSIALVAQTVDASEIKAGLLTTPRAKIETVTSNIANISDIHATFLRVGRAEFRELSADDIIVSHLSGDEAVVHTLEATDEIRTAGGLQVGRDAKVMGGLDAKRVDTHSLVTRDATIEAARIDEATIVGGLEAATITTRSLETDTATVDRLRVRTAEIEAFTKLPETLTVGTLAAVRVFATESAAFESVVIQDAVCERTLVAHELTARSLVADTITASNEITASLVTAGAVTSSGPIRAPAVDATTFTGQAMKLRSLEADRVECGTVTTTVATIDRLAVLNEVDAETAVIRAASLSARRADLGDLAVTGTLTVSETLETSTATITDLRADEAVIKRTEVSDTLEVKGTARIATTKTRSIESDSALVTVLRTESATGTDLVFDRAETRTFRCTGEADMNAVTAKTMDVCDASIGGLVADHASIKHHKVDDLEASLVRSMNADVQFLKADGDIYLDGQSLKETLSTLRSQVGDVVIWVTQLLPVAYTGIPYSHTLLAAVPGGADFDTPDATMQPFPPGLTVSIDGEISLNPTAPGTVPFTVRAKSRNDPTKYVDRDFSITVQGHVTWTTTTLPVLYTHKTISYQLEAVGTGVVEFSVLPANPANPAVLPTGFALSNTGLLTGTTTVPSTQTVVVRASLQADPTVFSDTTFTVTVSPLTLTWTNYVVPDQFPDTSIVPYKFAATASNGDAIEYTSPDLPVSNFFMDTSGILFGRVGVTGTVYTFTVDATVTGSTLTASQPVSFIAANPEIFFTTIAQLPDGYELKPYTFQIVTGGTLAATGIRVTISPNAGPDEILPPGFTLTDTGLLSAASPGPLTLQKLRIRATSVAEPTEFTERLFELTVHEIEVDLVGSFVLQFLPSAGAFGSNAFTIDEFGTVSGTPTQIGKYDVDVDVTIGANDTVVWNSDPPVATLGVPYTVSLAETTTAGVPLGTLAYDHDMAPYRFVGTANSGDAVTFLGATGVTGLAMNGDVLTGRPTDTGDLILTVSLSVSLGTGTNKVVTVPVPLSVHGAKHNGAALLDATAGQVYDRMLPLVITDGSTGLSGATATIVVAPGSQTPPPGLVVVNQRLQGTTISAGYDDTFTVRVTIPTTPGAYWDIDVPLFVEDDITVGSPSIVTFARDRLATPELIPMSTASGGATTVTTAINLPPGMTISPAGYLQGTPTQYGEFQTSLDVTAASTGLTVRTSFGIGVHGVDWTASAMPKTLYGTTYDEAIPYNAFESAPATLTFSITGTTPGSTAPPDLVVVGDRIVGDPAIDTFGVYAFTIRATLGSLPGQVWDHVVTIEAEEDIVWLTAQQTVPLSPVPFGLQMVPITLGAVALSGSPVTLVGTVVPAGLRFDPVTAKLEGIATAYGDHIVTIGASVSAISPVTDSSDYPISVYGVEWGSEDLDDAFFGVPYSHKFSYTSTKGVADTVTFSVTAGALPGGLDIVGDMVVGSVTVYTVATFTVSAEISSLPGYTWSRDFTLVSKDDITWSGHPLDATTAFETFNLSQGFTVDAYGVLTGTSNSLGETTFIVSVPTNSPTSVVWNEIALPDAVLGAPYEVPLVYSASYDHVPLANTRMMVGEEIVPYRFAVTASSGRTVAVTAITVPPDLVFDASTLTLSGIPSTPGPVVLELQSVVTGVPAPQIHRFDLVVDDDSVSPSDLIAQRGQVADIFNQLTSFADWYVPLDQTTTAREIKGLDDGLVGKGDPLPIGTRIVFAVTTRTAGSGTWSQDLVVPTASGPLDLEIRSDGIGGVFALTRKILLRSDPPILLAMEQRAGGVEVYPYMGAPVGSLTISGTRIINGDILVRPSTGRLDLRVSDMVASSIDITAVSPSVHYEIRIPLWLSDTARTDIYETTALPVTTYETMTLLEETVLAGGGRLVVYEAGIGDESSTDAMAYLYSRASIYEPPGETFVVTNAWSVWETLGYIPTAPSPVPGAVTKYVVGAPVPWARASDTGLVLTSSPGNEIVVDTATIPAAYRIVFVTVDLVGNTVTVTRPNGDPVFAPITVGTGGTGATAQLVWVEGASGMVRDKEITEVPVTTTRVVFKTREVSAIVTSDTVLSPETPMVVTGAPWRGSLEYDTSSLIEYHGDIPWYVMANVPEAYKPATFQSRGTYEYSIVDSGEGTLTDASVTVVPRLHVPTPADLIAPFTAAVTMAAFSGVPIGTMTQAPLEQVYLVDFSLAGTSIGEYVAVFGVSRTTGTVTVDGATIVTLTNRVPQTIPGTIYSETEIDGQRIAKVIWNWNLNSNSNSVPDVQTDLADIGTVYVSFATDPIIERILDTSFVSEPVATYEFLDTYIFGDVPDTGPTSTTVEWDTDVRTFGTRVSSVDRIGNEYTVSTRTYFYEPDASVSETFSSLVGGAPIEATLLVATFLADPQAATNALVAITGTSGWASGTVGGKPTIIYPRPESYSVTYDGETYIIARDLSVGLVVSVGPDNKVAFTCGSVTVVTGAVRTTGDPIAEVTWTVSGGSVVASPLILWAA